jgi:N-acetylglucosaminyl-diphospho-decaprenol L-rhamnosyltransferase
MTGFLDRVTVVTVTYQSAGLAAQLARVLDGFPHVVLIDNASTDGTADSLRALLPNARVIRNNRNLGFGPANNQGMRLATTEFALLLNPDCEIEIESVQRLVEAADRFPAAALIAPQGWHDRTTPQPSYRHAFYEQRAAQAYRIPDGTCSAKWLHGCCQLARLDAVRGFGGFDERFFLYYEDDDICLRALAAGHDCLLEPAANVLHAGGASSSASWRTQFRKHYFFFRSRRLILEKYVGRRAALGYRLKTALAAPLATLVYGLLLQRRHALKWLAWGCSAWTPSPVQRTNSG